MEKVITLRKGRVEITIRSYEEGYLATVNYFDKDGDVILGASGNFCDDKQFAAWTALDNYMKSFPDAPCPPFVDLIEKMQ